MGITAYARHRGCDLRAVQYAIKRGRITRNPDGTIDSEQADKDWEANTNHAQARYGPRNVAADHEQAQLKAASWAARRKEALGTNAAPDAITSSANFAQARAFKEFYDAKLRKLELDEKQGTLISSKEVRVTAFNTWRMMRDAALNIANRLSAQLAGETDPEIVREVLEAELRQVFDDFANGKIAASSEPREAFAS